MLGAAVSGSTLGGVNDSLRYSDVSLEKRTDSIDLHQSNSELMFYLFIRAERWYLTSSTLPIHEAKSQTRYKPRFIKVIWGLYPPHFSTSIKKHFVRSTLGGSFMHSMIVMHARIVEMCRQIEGAQSLFFFSSFLSVKPRLPTALSRRLQLLGLGGARCQGNPHLVVLSGPAMSKEKKKGEGKGNDQDGDWNSVNLMD